jgi:hypothetical protein
MCHKKTFGLKRHYLTIGKKLSYKLTGDIISNPSL